MKPALVVWSLILLIGFWASHTWQATYGEATLWMAWAIIFVIGHFAIGKTMNKKKKMPKDIMGAWMVVSIAGFLGTFAVALGVVSVSFSYLMSLWLLLVGAAWLVGSQKIGDATGQMTAYVYLFSAVLIPTVFASNYFIGGALVFGLIGLISSLFVE